MATETRLFLERHRVASTLACLLVLAAILGWFARDYVRAHVNTQPAPPPAVYFFELTTGKVFASPDVLPDLVKGPTGGESARAMVFSCGDCSQVSQRFVAWLEREEFAPDMAPQDLAARDRLWRNLRDSDDEGDGATLRLWLREPEGTEWVRRTEESLAPLREKATARCAEKGGELHGCQAQ